MKYLIKFMYDGSKFYGFQRQKKLDTVQAEIEKALSFIAKENVEIKGAGRTDRGVHAYAQFAHFNLKKPLKIDCLLKAIEKNTSKNIKIIECKEVNEDFHARFSVKQKTYLYKINVGEINPCYNDYYYQPRKKVSIKRLKEAAKLFVGTHDYKNFVSGSLANTIGTVFKIKIKKEKNIIKIYFTGKSFYRYMVRNIMGAMLDYSFEFTSLEEINSMLINPNIKKQLSTAPAEGLYLFDIKY